MRLLNAGKDVCKEGQSGIWTERYSADGILFGGHNLQNDQLTFVSQDRTTGPCQHPAKPCVHPIRWEIPASSPGR